MHVPIESAREAREMARALDADCAVAIGGGSTTGLGKAIALESGLPIIAVPTTYAGSEMTPIYGLTEGGLKKTGRDPRVLPKCVIYDPELTLDLPWKTTVASAFNAIAHAAEGLYAPDGNPVIALMAEEGIRASAAALLPLQTDPRDLDARGDALYGAWLAGACLGNVGMAIHHKLCHTLGGSFNLPHAETHTVILPRGLQAAPCPIARASAPALRGRGAGLYICQSIGAAALRRVSEATSTARRDRAKKPYANPRPIDRVHRGCSGRWEASPQTWKHKLGGSERTDACGAAGPPVLAGVDLCHSWLSPGASDRLGCVSQQGLWRLRRNRRLHHLGFKDAAKDWG
jgi:maleylacetate reductase